MSAPKMSDSITFDTKVLGFDLLLSAGDEDNDKMRSGRGLATGIGLPAVLPTAFVCRTLTRRPMEKDESWVSKFRFQHRAKAQ